MSPRRGTSERGPEGKGQQRRPSHGLERQGLGTLSQRAEQEAGQGRAEWGDMTKGKRSGDKDDDSADQNEADGHQAKSSDLGGEDVEEEPQVYQELQTRRAREQRGQRAWVVGEAATGRRAQARSHVQRNVPQA